MSLYTMIIAGGRGTRLWPLSRADQPKFLHPLTGTDLSLLQTTLSRLDEVSAKERTYVVTGVSHVAAVADQLPAVPHENLIVEPSPRDSCAAIGLATAIIARRDPAAVVGVFPADHLIREVTLFQEIIRSAATVAEQGFIVTLGIRPTRPEVGFGYMKLGGELNNGARMVAEFKEKPSLEVAQRYVGSGDYLWNAGMFVFQAATFLEELSRQRPALHEGLLRIAEAWGTAEHESTMARLWPTLEKISVDFGVMEGAATTGLVATVPADLSWCDVGDFHSLGEALPTDERGNIVVTRPTDVLLEDCASTVVVPASGRLVALLGLDDVVVVDTADVLLVSSRSRAQEVKQLVDKLAAQGKERLI